MPPTLMDLLVEFVKFVVALAALVGSVSIIAKAPYIRRPARWLFHNLIGAPISGWFRGEVTEIILETVPSIVDERLDARPWTNHEAWETVQDVQHTVEEIRDVVTSGEEDTS